jgi:hypothetical protein
MSDEGSGWRPGLLLCDETGGGQESGEEWRVLYHSGRPRYIWWSSAQQHSAWERKGHLLLDHID